MTRHRAPGVRRRRRPRRHQGVAAPPISPSSPPTTGGRSPPRASSPRTSRAPAGACLASATSRRPAGGRARSCSTAATPTAPPAPTSTSPRQMAALTAAAVRCGCGAEHVLVCSTGLIGIPLDPAPCARGIPAVAADLARRRRRRRGRAIMTTDTVPKDGRRRRRRLADRRHGQGRGDARPEHGDDARRAHHRRRRRARRRSRPTLAHAVGASFNRVVVDGCTVHQRHRARPGQRADGPARPAAVPRGARRSPASPSPGRWPPTPRAHTKVVTIEVVGAASDADAERVARKLADEPAREVQLLRQRPVLGPRAVASSGPPASTSTSTRSRSPTTTSWSRKGLAPTGADAAVVAARPAFTLRCDLGAGARQLVRAHQRPHPRVRRREHGDVVMRARRDAATRRASSSRRCPYIRRFAGRPSS